jgi:hypothetical protein
MRLRADVHTALKLAAQSFAGNALFPRLAYRLRWPTRLRGRRLVRYIVFNAAFLFCAREWLAPRLRSAAANVESVKRQLRWELGREPTEREIGERRVENRAWEMMPLMPDPKT